MTANKRAAARPAPRRNGGSNDALMVDPRIESEEA
jgi:hypothetical protein